MKKCLLCACVLLFSFGLGFAPQLEAAEPVKAAASKRATQTDAASAQPAAFVRADANGDGTVSKQEFEAFQANVFARADRNGDGNLDATEFARIGRGQRQQASATEGQPNSAKKSSAVSNGTTPKAPSPETRMERQGERIATERPQGTGLIARVDTNQNGKIERSEAPERMKQVFDRIDKNGDGALDAEELKQMSNQRRGAKAGAKRKATPRSK